VTVDNPILNLLAAPFRPDWTVDQLAEEVILDIAARASDEVHEFVIDAEAITDRQSLRVLRPLLACLATKSAAEGGTSPNLYGGRLSFERSDREGLVRVIGEFENTPGKVRAAFRSFRWAGANPRDASPAWTDQRWTVVDLKKSPDPITRKDIIPIR
jgi:hypothetical protein